MTAIRLLAPCQRFEFRAIPASLKTSVKACHRYSDCRSRFADKFHSVHSRRLPKSKIGNLKSKIAHAPLAQLAEQVTLNHDRSEVEFTGLPNMLPIPSDRDDICSESEPLFGSGVPKI
jgi:hypothetical protein